MVILLPMCFGNQNKMKNGGSGKDADEEWPEKLADEIRV
jgi:hypothetical protein